MQTLTAGEVSEEPIGSVMFHTSLSVYGMLGECACRALARAVVSAIGMTPRKEFADVFDPDASCPSPAPCTFILTLAESYVAVDSWPERGVAYLDVKSCRPYFALAVRDAILKEGFESGRGFSCELDRHGHVVRFEPL